MSKVYTVKKRHPRTAPSLGPGVRVIIKRPGWSPSPFGNVGEIIMRSHPGFWFVGVDRLFLKFAAEHLEAIPYSISTQEGTK